jgi:hypothetical protein
MNCHAMAAMSWLMLMMVVAAGCADKGGVPDMTDNQPAAEPGKQQVGTLEINRVFYDDEWQRWSVTAKLTNTSQEPLTIACDGDVSRLPLIDVPPAWVETRRMDDGQWKDITPMMDAIGINHDIDPGQHVVFDAAIPHTAKPGDQLRLVVMGVASEPFTLPAEPASDR